jgi:hypothetical protein
MNIAEKLRLIDDLKSKIDKLMPELTGSLQILFY